MHLKRSKRQRFEIWLTAHERDRKIASWIDAQPNAGERVKIALAEYIEAEEARKNG